MTTTSTTPDLLRLGAATVDRLPRDQRPRVDRADLEPRVLHLGLGAFHRAHQAVYTENAVAAGDDPWGIVDVEPLAAGAVDAMRAQDCLYSVTDRRPDGLRTRVVGSVVDALLMGRDDARIGALLVSERVPVVTLTVTEKGYHRRADTDGLDLTAEPVVADLAATSAGVGAGFRTVVGRVAAGLVARSRANGAPISIVSCDNMAGNGPALARVVRELVEASAWPDRDAVLDWMGAAVAFPATIVDRIVPATTAEDRDLASAALGLRDEMPVLGEPYRQWVLEDSFAADRPRWELDGALFVPDVAPYQLMKLRLLNGAHSALAYLGLAAGCATVAEAMATAWGPDLVRRLGAEVAPTLPDIGLDADAYAEGLVDRFSNPSIHHLLRQIGSDGSLKVPERWLGPLRELRAAGRPAPVLETALAGWVAATAPGADGGQRYGTTDPSAAALVACWGERTPLVGTVAALLRAVGADDLADSADLVRAVAERLPALAMGRVEL
jgi:fructuronate reductase